MSLTDREVVVVLGVRDRAKHYAGFKVGCIGFYTGSDGASHILQGANHKPTPDAQPICAEMWVMLAAEEIGVTLDSLVVAGQPRKEDTTRTLHCCGERCRPRMRKYMREGRVITPDTKLTCINVRTGVVEFFTVKTLHEFHKESLEDE